MWFKKQFQNVLSFVQLLSQIFDFFLCLYIVESGISHETNKALWT